MSRKMMLVTFMVLPFLAARPVLAQDTLKLDLGKALEIALSENPTVKVADKEIQKKKYARKGSYASLFPQISFAGDYNAARPFRALLRQGYFRRSVLRGTTTVP